MMKLEETAAKRDSHRDAVSRGESGCKTGSNLDASRNKKFFWTCLPDDKDEIEPHGGRCR